MTSSSPSEVIQHTESSDNDKRSILCVLIESKEDDCTKYRPLDLDPVAALIGENEHADCLQTQEGMLFHMERPETQVWCVNSAAGRPADRAGVVRMSACVGYRLPGCVGGWGS